MLISPKLFILPESQRLLWPYLKEIPSDFVLYGGTAIALRYGHRQSVDFDFFSSMADGDIAVTTQQLSFIKKFAINYGEPVVNKTLDSSQIIYDLDMGKNKIVEVTFLRDRNFIGGSINAPHVSIDNGIKIATPMDLMATKINAVLYRQSVKDLVDIATLITNKISFSRGFAYAMALKKSTLIDSVTDYTYLLNAFSTTEFYTTSFDRDKNAPKELKLLVENVAATVIKEAEKLSMEQLLSMKLKVSPCLHSNRGSEECER